MGRRTVLLISALLVAALGTTLIFLYVRGLSNEVEAGQEPVEVLVATAPISTGTSGAAAQEQGALKLQTIPRSAAADGAVSTIDPIANLVALAPIFPGEQLLTVKFGDLAAIQSVPIPDGKMAVSVQLSDPARVAGFVRPESEVAILVTSTSNDEDSETSTSVLLDRVPVIGIGATTVVTQTAPADDGATAVPAEQIPSAILTLAVDQEQAQKIVLAQSVGQLYFTLLRDDTKTTVGQAVTPPDLFR